MILLKVFLADKWFWGESIAFFVDSIIHFTMKYLITFHQITLYYLNRISYTDLFRPDHIIHEKACMLTLIKVPRRGLLLGCKSTLVMT